MNANHVQALEEKHAEVDGMLHQEMCRPAPDQIECANLKRRKLALKDEIAAERAELAN